MPTPPPVAATAASAPTTAVVNSAKGAKAVDTARAKSAADTVPAKSVLSTSPAAPVTNTEAAAPAPVATVAKSATTAARPVTSAASSTGVYSVQVAAYNHKPDASKLVASLVKRGYAARVDGDIVPFRVRIGRYSSEGEAEKALTRMKAKHMSGFVVRAPKGE